MKYVEVISYEWWLGIGLALVTLVGFFRVRAQAVAKVERISLAQQFREKFIDYVNSRGKDIAAYQWMLRKSSKIQEEMGAVGLYAQFTEPFNRGVHYNYAIILNMIPKIRELISDTRHDMYGGNTLYGDMIDSYVHAVDDALIRYLGRLEDGHSTGIYNPLNPFNCFRAGMEILVSIPLFLLSSFGLLGARTLEKILQARVFRILARVAALIAFVGTIMGMLVDGPQLMPMVRDWSPSWAKKILNIQQEEGGLPD